MFKIYYVLRVAVAAILIQSLYFKFTGHPEAQHIFGTLGVEPYGRIGLGIFELATSILLLIPRTFFYGLVLAIGLMIGAIATHLFTEVGIVVKWDDKSDNGELFLMACIAFILAIISFLLECKSRKLSPITVLFEIVTLKR